jgi:threonine dehydratase
VAATPRNALPSLSAIEEARILLRDVLVATPVLPVDTAVAGAGGLFVKCENLQRTGSFKMRGAYNRIAGLTSAERAQGVVAYSSGNHAQGVACAASLLGVHATIVMPENAVPTKLQATRRYGADVVFAGTDSETRRHHAESLALERRAALVPPYDHGAIIAGQGTIGLEILEQVPDAETIVVPVGGGGLIAGISLAVKLTRPSVRVVGAEPEGAADAGASLRAGHIVALEHVDTIADGLRARRVGELPFEAIRAHVDDIVSVSDSAILDAVRLLLTTVHVVAEPSGAVALAAALSGAARGRTVAVISGGNIDAELLQTIARIRPV